MPQFEFNLEAVLKQRTWAERERQRTLAAVLAEMAGLERQLQALDGAAKESAQELRGGRLVGAVDLVFLAGHGRFVQATERRAAELIGKMRALRPKIEEARRLLMEAGRARKVVEKLRERKLTEWKGRMLTAEQQEADDVGMKLTIAGWQEDARTADDVRDGDES